jgi:hypothetical protein
MTENSWNIQLQSNKKKAVDEIKKRKKYQILLPWGKQDHLWRIFCYVA